MKQKQQQTNIKTIATDYPTISSSLISCSKCFKPWFKWVDSFSRPQIFWKFVPQAGSIETKGLVTLCSTTVIPCGILQTHLFWMSGLSQTASHHPYIFSNMYLHIIKRKKRTSINKQELLTNNCIRTLEHSFDLPFWRN